MSTYNGIAGLEGRSSVGVALTVGVKGDRGFPVERDRFHLVWPQEDESGKRIGHPRFAPYNRAEAKHRRSIYGVLVHATVSECFEYSLRAQSPKGQPSPPSRRPFCTGDGVSATRFTGVRNDVEVFDSIACPHNECQFRKTDPAACKPHMRFMFMLAWGDRADLPSMLCKYTSNAWNTTREFVGFFDQITGIGRAFGLPANSINLAGLRFVLQLTERSNRVRKSRYPVVTITPIDDIADFLLRQSERAAQITSSAPLASLTDRSQRDPSITANDFDLNEVPQSEE